MSLGTCSRCLVVDDELNILPISTHARNIKSIQKTENESIHEKELNELKESFKDSEVVGDVISNTKTLDQAKALLVFIEAISEKTLRTTVALTAARGK